MPKYNYALANGKTLTLEGDSQPSDADVEQAASAQGVSLVPAKSIAERNAEARVNMAKQHSQGAPTVLGFGGGDMLADFAHSGPMENMGNALQAASEGNGARAVHQAVVGAGKVTAPMLIPAAAAAPLPVALGLVGSAVGDAAARKGASMVTDNPDYVDVAGDVGGLAGGVAGGAAGTKVHPVAALRFAGKAMENTPTYKQMIGRGLNAAADKLEGDSAAVALAKANEKAGALGEAAKIEDATKRKLQTEAERENAARDKAKTSTKSSAKPSKAEVAAQEERDRLAANGVVPTADAAASNPAAAVPPSRTPARTGDLPQSPLDRNDAQHAADLRSQLIAQMEEKLGVKAPEGADASVGVHPVNQQGEPLPTQGAGSERFVDKPLFQQMEQLPEVASPAGNGRKPIVTHEQVGPGGRGMETAPPRRAPEDPARLDEMLKSMELVGDEGGPNGSGESAASREALSRQAGMKARGEAFAVRKGGSTRMLAGPDAVDYNPQPGEQFGIVDKDGQFRMLSLGEAIHKVAGSHGKGDIGVASRKALMNALLKRAGQRVG
jgi:hypothetical protein